MKRSARELERGGALLLKRDFGSPKVEWSIILFILSTYFYFYFIFNNAINWSVSAVEEGVVRRRVVHIFIYIFINCSYTLLFVLVVFRQQIRWPSVWEVSWRTFSPYRAILIRK